MKLVRAAPGCTKELGNVVPVAGVDRMVDEAEFFTLLAPSGWARRPSAPSRELRTPQRRPDLVPPYLPNINTVYQDNAQFPHLSFAEKIGYGPARQASLETGITPTGPTSERGVAGRCRPNWERFRGFEGL